MFTRNLNALPCVLLLIAAEMVVVLVQAAVLGVTSSHDVKDFMEKRVRSRFSYRKFIIDKPISGWDPQDRNSAVAVLQDMLALPEGEGEGEGAGFSDRWYARTFNRSVRQALREESVKVRGPACCCAVLFLTLFPCTA